MEPVVIIRAGGHRVRKAPGRPEVHAGPHITALPGPPRVANPHTGPAWSQPRGCPETLLCTTGKFSKPRRWSPAARLWNLWGAYRRVGLTVGTSTPEGAGVFHTLLRQMCHCSGWFLCPSLLLQACCFTPGCTGCCSAHTLQQVCVCLWWGNGWTFPFLKSSLLCFNLPLLSSNSLDLPPQEWKCTEMLIWILPKCARLFAMRICPWHMAVREHLFKILHAQ